MLGIPTADQHRFHRWSSAIVASTAAPNLMRLLPAVWRFVRYLRKVIAAKRSQPDDALVRAQEAGDPSTSSATSPIEVSTERYAREAIEIAGVTIPTGALVYGLISSANRDESQFDEPDRLDVGREKNRHLAFGQGIHYCLGASLARLKGQIALRRLLERMPRLRLAVPESALRWRRD